MESLSNNSIEQLFRKCLDAVSLVAGSASEKTVEKYLQELGYFSLSSTLPNAVYQILDMRTLTYKFVANTELALGIHPDAFLEKGVPMVLSMMVPKMENVSAIPELLKYMYNSIKEAPREVRENFVAYGYGIQYLRPSKKSFHSMVQLIGLEFDEEGLPTLCFLINQDIEHLVKKLDNYLGRTSFRNSDFVTTFSSSEMQMKKQDIFSDREIDVLKMLLKGYDSKQIAEKLFISSNTVDNHRKNMIRKLDARDTTALVQLAKLLGILK